MIQLILGGSASGKSFYAEQEVLSLAAGTDAPKYYLATMRDESAEGLRRIRRHRRLRAGKGFRTVEQPADIHLALDKMAGGERIALLECISGLTANEMFAGAEFLPEHAVAEKIIREVGLLGEGLTHLVIVSCNVFEDGAGYDDATMEYIRAMGRIHRELAVLADRVVELAAGIPILVKGRKEP